MIKLNIKKLIALSLFSFIIIDTSTTTYASENQARYNSQSAYENVMSYATKNGINLDMSYADFIANNNGQSLESYENSFYEVLLSPTVESKSSSDNDPKYYYNTGTSCPSAATYSKYNLLSVVKKGDIIYEANGGFGITGHIAIVEGIYTRFNGTVYIRLIEAIDVGVVRSILDDTRVDDKAVTILRVSGATTTDINNAVSFCVGELGSSYNLDLAKDTSSTETDWYCSELVWAAYQNQGIDVEVSSLGEPGITPHDILNSSNTYSISYY